MDTAMEQAFVDVDRKMERVKFILIIVLFIGFAAAGLFLAVHITEYSPESDLVYEKLTFIRYEYGKNKSKYCRIYVNEYEKPLEITSITMEEMDETVLKSIRPGDSIHVCTNGEGRLAIFICSALYKGKPLLAYEDYLAAHASNDQIRVILGWLFFSLSGLVIASQSNQYAVHEKCYPIYTRFSPDRPTVRDIVDEVKQARKKTQGGKPISMKKHQLLISFIPILGSFLYTLFLFLTDRAKFLKAFLPILAGIGSFIAVYGGFAAICNAIGLDLISYNWFIYLLLAFSGIIWNVVYFSLLNRLSK